MEPLTSADLFSGAGGFTEGFHQSGYEVLASLDNWGPAADTHWRNYPKTVMFHADILEFDPSELPRVDVLVGSPPCTQFSYANKGGHGDITSGMRLVLRFLRFVHDVRPRYWAMENVPRLVQSLPPRVHLRRLGLREDGFLEIPVRRVLNAADYGAPQKRLRLFSGRFPIPSPSHYGPGSLSTFDGAAPWLVARDVLEGLPDPLSRGTAPPEVSDPNYGFRLPVDRLSDHFMDTTLSEEEVRINRKSKMDHSWYGRMAFPDPIDRPARTVMATQTGVSRETLVVAWNKAGRPVYRRPTIRECATFQTFPITYQFWGSTAEARYRLVGNAVPPVLAGAVARAIARKVGSAVPPTPLVRTEPVEAPPPVEVARRKEGFSNRRFPVDRKFRDHLPGSRFRGFRVDIDNAEEKAGETSPRPGRLGHPRHYRVWTARLYVGSGKDVRSVAPSFEQSLDLLAGALTTEEERGRARAMGAAMEQTLANRLPDATTLQAAWAGKIVGREFGPDRLLVELAAIVDAAFPSESYGSVYGPVSPRFASIGREAVPVRTAAFLAAARFATEVINERSPGETIGVRALAQFSTQSGYVLATRRPRSKTHLVAERLEHALTFSPSRAARRGAATLGGT